MSATESKSVSRTRFVRMPEIAARVALSRPCIYKQLELRQFPPLIRLGGGTVLWQESTLDALIANRMEIRAGMGRNIRLITIPKWDPEAPALEPPEATQLLRLPEVMAQMDVSQSFVYRAIRDRGFPAPIPITERARRWLEYEVDAWLRSLGAVSMRVSGELSARRLTYGPK